MLPFRGWESTKEGGALLHTFRFDAVTSTGTAGTTTLGITTIGISSMVGGAATVGTTGGATSGGVSIGGATMVEQMRAPLAPVRERGCVRSERSRDLQLFLQHIVPISLWLRGSRQIPDFPEFRGMEKFKTCSPS